MTRAHMPGRGTASLHAAQPPRCSFADSVSTAERAMLAELGVLETPPQLHLVPRIPAPAPRATPAADLRQARRRALAEDAAMWAVLLASIAAAVSAVVSQFPLAAP